MSESGKGASWQENKTLQECMLYMLQNEIMCDVTFRVGENQTIVKAHKYMLASRSPVFQTMFDGSLPEKGEVIVPDVDEETFRIILKYIYSDKFIASIDNIDRIIYTAEKYMLSKITSSCTNLLKKSVKTGNATLVLETALHFQLEELKNECLKYLKENLKDCLENPKTINISREVLNVILQLENVYCAETDICKFVMQWAINHCVINKKEVNGEEMRKSVGPLLYLVRFPLVDKSYFALNVAETGILTTEEQNSVFLSHYGKKCEKFKDAPRLKTREHRIIRYGSISQPYRQYTKGHFNALIVRADKEIYLSSIAIFGPVQTIQESDRSINLWIFDHKDSIILSHRYESSLDPCAILDIKLPNSVLLSAGNKYTIKLESTNFDSYYCRNCETRIKTGGEVTIDFENSPMSSTNTNVQIGQIAGLSFYTSESFQ